MFQVPMINQIVEWERRLEIEEETRKNLRGEPYTDFTTNPQSNRKEHRSIFARIFNRGGDRLPVRHGYTQKPCGETQPGC